MNISCESCSLSDNIAGCMVTGVDICGPLISDCWGALGTDSVSVLYMTVVVLSEFLPEFHKIYLYNSIEIIINYITSSNT